MESFISNSNVASSPTSESSANASELGLLRCLKKRLIKRLLLQAPQAPFKAPIHSKCCIGGFRVTGLALVVVLRCDWPLCDLRIKSYEHFKLKIFLSKNLMYLTAKILRTVHWKCTSQIRLQQSCKMWSFLHRSNLSNQIVPQEKRAGRNKLNN